MKVTYDPDVVSYNQLVTYFLHHIDPTDASGQFCDKGESYRSAIFVSTPDERATAEADLADVSATLPSPVATKVINADTFWPAEDYHQDYYQKNPRRSHRSLILRSRARRGIELRQPVMPGFPGIIVTLRRKA